MDSETEVDATTSACPAVEAVTSERTAVVCVA